MKERIARFAALAAVLTVSFVSAGCLVKDTTATLVLEPDGAATWTVLERNIHATGGTPADRQREETEFMALVGADGHPKAVAFRALGGLDVRTDVVSSRWPFAVLTEARFPDIARVFQQVFDKTGELHGRSALERNGDRTTWKITIEYDPDAPQADSDDGEDIVTSLLDFDGGQPVVLMQHGQFVDGVGFDVTDDGRVAKLQDLDKHDWDKDPKLVLSLTWVAAEAGKARSGSH